jgi:nickel/cobalt exporter
VENLSLIYLPTAVALGALHALEPGHAKTLTAAYLIGVKGTRRDAVVLGLAVAATHSAVVIGLSVCALTLGRQSFTDDALYWLQLGGAIIVILLGGWMLWRRWPRRAAPHQHAPDSVHAHSHDSMSEDEHARAHAAQLPDYVREGQRPTLAQIAAFGAAGGLIPCPASVTVMLLALSINQVAMGLLAVLGFSVGLALTLVCVGLAVVAGLEHLSHTGRFAAISRFAPLISAAMVILSGVFALCFVR